jgi:hypothetical protein
MISKALSFVENQGYLIPFHENRDTNTDGVETVNLRSLQIYMYRD